jgi:hypothetical protein
VLQRGIADFNTFESNILIITSMSYFAYDFLACLYYDLSDTGLVVHHTTALVGYSFVLLSRIGGVLSVCTDYLNLYILDGLLCAEISNCPMHIRVILRNLNLRYTLTYELCESIYLLSYMLFRGIVFPIILV